MPTPVDVVEALLFASEMPLEAERIREVLDLADVAEARALVDELRDRYGAADRALTIAEVAGGFRMVTRSDVAPWLLKLAKTRTRARLSRPAVEALAIIAYRQPVSRPEVDAIRGVNSEGVLDSLLERRLVRISGRKEAPGRPFLYETTRDFLVAFGLRDLADLPKVEGELVVDVDTGGEPSEQPGEAAADAVDMGGGDMAPQTPQRSELPGEAGKFLELARDDSRETTPGERADTPEGRADTPEGRADAPDEPADTPVGRADAPTDNGEAPAQQDPGAGRTRIAPEG